MHRVITETALFGNAKFRQKDSMSLLVTHSDCYLLMTVFFIIHRLHTNTTINYAAIQTAVREK